jgi:hypothetical protein
LKLVVDSTCWVVTVPGSLQERVLEIIFQAADLADPGQGPPRIRVLMSGRPGPGEEHKVSRKEALNQVTRIVSREVPKAYCLKRPTTKVTTASCQVDLVSF